MALRLKARRSDRLGRARVWYASGTIAGMAGGAMLAVLSACWLIPSDGVRFSLRERSLDHLLPLVADRYVPTGAGPAALPQVEIVDIDRASLARIGPWPWPHERLARLVANIASGRPKVLALDILIAEPDRLSPAALARALGAATGRSEIAALASELPDADASLAASMRSIPAVLGFVFDPEVSGTPLPPTPILSRGQLSLPDIWQAPGLIGPTPEVAAGARGFGALVLAADQDGLIRRVPLLIVADGIGRPGLAVETVRLAQDAGGLIAGPGARLEIGEITVPLDDDATLRLVPRPDSWWNAHRISAAAIYDDASAASVLSGQIVLLGGSAPELGGLRETPASAVTPSVLVQAIGIETLLRGPLPRRPGWLSDAEIVAVLVLGILGLWLAIRLRPLPAAALMALTCVIWFGIAVWALLSSGLLLDPTGPPLIAAVTFATAALARFVRDDWRARRLRASFEQHLAPEVVRRISADPGALRLRGEQREITAFFTDVEGFTSMTERAEPTDLVALLDDYFDVASRVVMAHGGMIEKIVGDAVHAIFNAPFALDDHPRRAVDCALALLAESELVRRSPLGQKLRLGRTRIGIETGTATVGDIGGSRKLDYTAHGNVMNTAARLEAANKELGSSICIGPGTAGRLGLEGLRPLGIVTPRGQTHALEVFTPKECPEIGGRGAG